MDFEHLQNDAGKYGKSLYNIFLGIIRRGGSKELAIGKFCKFDHSFSDDELIFASKVKFSVLTCRGWNSQVIFRCVWV